MIIVFGSVNIDIVMQIERLPRPGETVLGGICTLVPGGKGANQACAAARAAGPEGRPVAMVGRIGGDDWGRQASELLRGAGVEMSALQAGASHTGCATIAVDRAGENAIAVASGANMEATAAQVPDDWLGPASWLVLQMEVPLSENWRLIERARNRGCRILLNVAPAAKVPEAVLDQVDVLVLNEIEVRMLAESLGWNAADEVRTAQRLTEAHGLNCIVTLGAAGALAVTPEDLWRVGCLPITPVDTTGAGDAFVGALASRLALGEALPEALRFASVAAALCCTVAGAQTSFAWHRDIEARLDELAPARAAAV